MQAHPTTIFYYLFSKKAENPSARDRLLLPAGEDIAVTLKVTKQADFSFLLRPHIFHLNN